MILVKLVKKHPKISDFHLRTGCAFSYRLLGEIQSISEDIIKDNESEIQKITDEHIEKLNALQNDKEKEILEV